MTPDSQTKGSVHETISDIDEAISELIDTNLAAAAAVSFSPRPGIHVVIGKVGVSFHRPTVSRPGWMSLSLSNFEVEMDPKVVLHLGNTMYYLVVLMPPKPPGLASPGLVYDGNWIGRAVT
jgi:hypothetical protein